MASKEFEWNNLHEDDNTHEQNLAITGMIKGEVKTSIKKGGWMDQQNGFKQDEWYRWK